MAKHQAVGVDIGGTGIKAALVDVAHGAIIGDRAEVGCNAVLSPGSVVGRDCVIYPGVQWRGVLPARSVAKLRQQIEIATRS